MSHCKSNNNKRDFISSLFKKFSIRSKSTTSSQQQPPTTTSTTNSIKSPSSRLSKSFTKPLSLPHKDTILPANNSSPIEHSTNLSCDGHQSTIISSHLSSGPPSANETADTSLASTEDQLTDTNEESGLAGIGIRNRNSICLYSLPIPIDLTPQTNNKPIHHHPAMRYLPSSSSPLSTNLEPNTNFNRRFSSISQLDPPHIQDDRRLSFGHLNLVPNQTTVDSQTLIRILRGPSSYPNHTRPRPNSHRDPLYVPCV